MAGNHAANARLARSSMAEFDSFPPTIRAWLRNQPRNWATSSVARTLREAKGDPAKAIKMLTQAVAPRRAKAPKDVADLF